MDSIILCVLFLITALTGILYCRPVKTFEIQKIPNIIIFFASRTSSIISGLYYFYMAAFILLLLVQEQNVIRFSLIFFIPFAIINGLYGSAWAINFFFIKKRRIIGWLAFLNIVSMLLSLLYAYKIYKYRLDLISFHIPNWTSTSFENILMLICILCLIPLILWHFYAPFAMNWKMWLTRRELNVLSEAFIIFFYTGFPIFHLFFNIYYYSFYKEQYFGYYIFFITLFAIILSIKLFLWLTYTPQTNYFKSFKYKLLPVLLSLITICCIFLFINLI